MISFGKEKEIHKAVRLGLLEIRADGSIWKTGELRGNRWNARLTLRTFLPMRAERDIGQYLQVRIMANSVRVHCLAHRLVWFHYNGPIPAELQINHKNGNKKDNRLENLELVTPVQNINHAIKTGLIHMHGEDNPRCKLTDRQVEAVRLLYSKVEMNQTELAALYGVTSSTISKTVRGESRSRQSGPISDYIVRRKKKTSTESERLKKESE